MSTKYRFTVNGVEMQPHWADSLFKEYELESEQQFFRSKLQGSLIFISTDFDYLYAQPFDTQFNVTIERYVNGGWGSYFTGYFTKPDGVWDTDNKKVEVSLTSLDSYTEILAKSENEYDLIKLAPAITPLRYYRRPLLQAYLPGENIIACFMGGLYWEQEVVEPELDTSVLENTYKFLRGATFFKAAVDDSNADQPVGDDYVDEASFDGSEFTESIAAFSENRTYSLSQLEGLTSAYAETTITDPCNSSGNIEIDYEGLDQVLVSVTSGDSINVVGQKIEAAVNADSSFPLRCLYKGSGALAFEAKTLGASPNGNDVNLDAVGRGVTFEGVAIKTLDLANGMTSGTVYILNRRSDRAYLYRSLGGYSSQQLGNTITLYAIDNAGTAAGSVEVTISTLDFFTRYITDADFFGIFVTEDLPSPDLVPDNRNYSKVASVGVDFFTIINESSEEPTEYGLRPDGKYYIAPTEEEGEWFPAGRSAWDSASIWFNAIDEDYYSDNSAEPFTLNDGYKISDCIKALLSKMDDTVQHEATEEYSEFMYGAENPINSTEFTLMVTPKSNVLVGEYDQPAKKAPITFNDIMMMLKDCYKLYWFIEDGKLKIEHIKYFKNGGSYDIAPEVGTDLTLLEDPRTRKPWAFQSSNWEYEKADIAERIEFEWMDRSTYGFTGNPIEIQSVYVTRGNVQDINVGRFTSDIDFMLTSPEDINREGFALFAAVYDAVDEIHSVPIVELDFEGLTLHLQNGYASFIYMQEQYWVWELPARTALINGEQITASGVLRNKKQQVMYPLFEDPNLFKLVKTYIGNGEIEKLSINLSSRMATADLRYDTDE